MANDWSWVISDLPPPVPTNIINLFGLYFSIAFLTTSKWPLVGGWNPPPNKPTVDPSPKESISVKNGNISDLTNELI